LFILLVLNVMCGYSQENLTVFLRGAKYEKVCVYVSEKNDKVCAEIQEDSLLENWHNVEIIGNGKNRYNVIIRSEQHPNTFMVKGWINKKNCGVYLYGRHRLNNQYAVNVYQSPHDSKPIMTLLNTCPDSFPQGEYGAVPVLDVYRDGTSYWVKISIRHDGKSIVGWTKDYCPNVYGSCN